MSIRVVVIGDSLMSTMVSKEIDRRFGNLTHMSLKYLTASNTLIYPHQSTIFGRLQILNKQRLLDHTQVIETEVKSLNLDTKTIVTTGGVEEYDYLVVDQQPKYTETFYKDLRDQLTTLYATLEASQKTGQVKSAQVTVEGNSLESCQLAMAIRRDSLSHHQSRLIVRYLNPGTVVGSFLTASGVRTRELGEEGNLPGLKIAEPKSMVEAKMIKGAKVANNGEAIVDATWHSGKHRRAIVIPKSISKEINMISATSVLARQVSEVLSADIEDKPSKIDEIKPRPAIMLRGVRESFLTLDDWRSKRFRARLAGRTEKFLWHKLSS